MRFIGRHVLNLVGLLMLAFMFCLDAVVIAAYMGITSGALPGFGTYEITRMGDIPEWLVFLNIILTIYVYTVVVRWCARGPVARERAKLIGNLNELRNALGDVNARYERAVTGHNDTIQAFHALQGKLEALQNAQALPATAEETVAKIAGLFEGWSTQVNGTSEQLAGVCTTLDTASAGMQQRVTALQSLFGEIESRARTVVGALGDDTDAKTALMATAPEVASASVHVEEDDRVEILILLKTLKKFRDNNDLTGAEDILVNIFEAIAERYKARTVTIEQYLVVLWVVATTLVEYAGIMGDEGSELRDIVERYLPEFAEISI